MMKTKSYMKMAWIPGVLVMLVIAGYYAYEPPNSKELLPIWLPWTAIMFVISTIGFMIFTYLMQTKHLWVQITLILAFLGFSFFGIRTGFQDGDPLSRYPICAQGVLTLVYMIISALKLVKERFPEQKPEPAG